jgi:hypothetical protein
MVRHISCRQPCGREVMCILCLTFFFVYFFVSLQTNAGIVPPLGHDRFLAYPLQFINCPIIRLHIFSILPASLNNQLKEIRLSFSRAYERRSTLKIDSSTITRMTHRYTSLNDGDEASLSQQTEYRMLSVFLEQIIQLSIELG